MATQRPGADRQDTKAHEPADDFGDDWEAAFQEEDYAFAQNDKSNDFSFDENFAPQSKSLPPELEEIAVSETPSPQTGEIAPQSGTPAALASTSLRPGIFFSLFPKSNKKRVYLALFLLVAGAAGFFFWHSERPGPEIKETEKMPVAPPTLGEIGPPGSEISAGMPSSASPDAVEAPLSLESPGEALPVAVEAPAVPPPVAAQPEKDRKKWFFPGFLVPAAENDQSPVVFFQIDITLIVPVEKGGRLPEEKRSFVRDIIYQFFSNRPLDELRRYSLARSEMNRRLKAWMDKEWPGNPISIIVINRYQAG